MLPLWVILYEVFEEYMFDVHVLVLSKLYLCRGAYLSKIDDKDI